MDYKDLFYRNYLSKNPYNLRQYTSFPFERSAVFYEKYYGVFLPKDKGAKILDIACGPGSLLWWLQKKGFKNSWGIDISSEQIEFGRKKGVSNLKTVDLWEFLSSCSKDYDFVFANDIIEHFPKEKVMELLRLINSILKQEGTFLLATSNANSPFASEVRYDDFTHEVSFTPNSLIHVLSLSGFKEIKVYPKEPVVHGLKSCCRWLFWKMIKQILKFYLIVEKGVAGDGILTRVMYAVAKK